MSPPDSQLPVAGRLASADASASLCVVSRALRPLPAQLGDPGPVMDVSDRTLGALGFEDIRAALAARCRTEVGQERARARGFLQSRDEVQASLTLSEEARELKAEPITLPITGIVDIRTSLDRASKSGMLEPRELINVCQVLFSFERTHELLVSRRERLPGLATLGRRLPVLSKLATRLDRSFEASGEISDRASTDLRDARETARGLHRRIRGRLDELLRDETFSRDPARGLLLGAQRSLRGAGEVEPPARRHGHRPQRQPVRPDALRRARRDDRHGQRTGHRAVHRARGRAQGAARALGPGRARVELAARRRGGALPAR